LHCIWIAQGNNGEKKEGEGKAPAAEGAAEAGAAAAPADEKQKLLEKLQVGIVIFVEWCV